MISLPTTSKKYPKNSRSVIFSKRRKKFFKAHPRWSNITSSLSLTKKTLPLASSQSPTLQQVNKSLTYPCLEDLFAKNHLCCYCKIHHVATLFQIDDDVSIQKTEKHYSIMTMTMKVAAMWHWCYYFQAGPNLTFFLKYLLQLPRVTFIKMCYYQKKSVRLSLLFPKLSPSNWCSSWSRHMKLYFCAVCKSISSRLREDH